MANLVERYVLTEITLVGEFRNADDELESPDEATVFYTIVDDDGETVLDATEAEGVEETEGVFTYAITPAADEFGILSFDWQGTGGLTAYGGGSIRILPRQVVPGDS